MNVHANHPFATESKGQIRFEMHDDTITLSASEERLQDILLVLAENTDIRVAYQDATLSNKQVSVNVDGKNLSNTLRKLLKNFSYTLSYISGTPNIHIYNHRSSGNSSDMSADSTSSVLSRRLPPASHASPELEEITEEISRRYPRQIENAEQIHAEEERLREQESVDRAINVLQGSEFELQDEALNYLVGHNSHEATTTLIRVANNTTFEDAEERIDAVDALISHVANLEFRDAQSVDAIKALAKDKDPHISQMARQALRGMEAYLELN